VHLLFLGLRCWSIVLPYPVHIPEWGWHHLWVSNYQNLPRYCYYSLQQEH